MSHIKQRDAGSVLPLMIGLFALVFMSIGGLVSIAEIQQERRWLYQRADEAVLAATTALDLDDYYRSGANPSISLSPDHVRQRLAQTLGASAEVVSVNVVGDRVELVLSRTVRLAWGLSRAIRVEVAARAR